MSRNRECDSASCKVYVGNLGKSASKCEIENAFSKYGSLRSVWVARNPPGFAFVDFDQRQDAEAATRGLDGTFFCGARIRVEISSGRLRGKRGGGGGGGRGGVDRDDRKSSGNSGRRYRSRSPDRSRTRIRRFSRDHRSRSGSRDSY